MPIETDGAATGPQAASPLLTDRLDKLSFALEKMNLAEYTELLRRPWRLLWVNFMAGLARGVGMAVGFSVLGAVLLYLLRDVMMARLPDLADLTATIVKMVELNMRR